MLNPHTDIRRPAVFSYGIKCPYTSSLQTLMFGAHTSSPFSVLFFHSRLYLQLISPGGRWRSGRGRSEPVLAVNSGEVARLQQA